MKKRFPKYYSNQLPIKKYEPDYKCKFSYTYFTTEVKFKHKHNLY